MQVILYDPGTLQVLDKFMNLNQVEVGMEKITWINEEGSGGIGGYSGNFIVLEDIESVGQSVTQEQIQKDRKNEFLNYTARLELENQDFKNRLKIAEDAILTLMNFV